MKLPKFKDMIVMENDHYIIINKPPYVSALEDRDKTKTNIDEMAKAYCEGAQLCHRIDKETSGILAIAKTPEAYRNLSMQFEKREVDKVYHAIVDGTHEFDRILVDRNIAVSGRGNVRIDIEGKPAQTKFMTLEIFRNHSLVACKPVTGRMHQIRIHLAYLGAPISADELYGGQLPYLSQLKRKFNLKKGTIEEPLMKRVALHARELHFLDVDGTEVHVEAEYPKDFRAYLRQLEKSV
ncbi:RNA pseudouridine synthase [Algivirga pacifica]|uniref:RluA family pseudouridine synthase n=1 Tax=Algivirga pacifica TaxID=1162670 RepID=A0ABP9DCX0_9BACT